MSSTPKSKRTPPARRLEEYTLTYEKGPGTGLYPIASSQMKYFDETVDAGGDVVTTSGPYSASTPAAPVGTSLLHLGFDFLFDGKRYTKLYISVSGWAALLERDRAVTSPYSSFISDFLSSTIEENSILDSFTYDDVILAPWFDNIRNVSRSYSGAGDRSTIYSSFEGGGVKYFLGNDRLGRFALIRWTSYADTDGAEAPGGDIDLALRCIARFDLVIYECGLIEFRYGPRLDFPNRSVSNSLPWNFSPYTGFSATVGIFASGPSFSSNRYRDFGGLLRVGGTDSRGTYVNGGSIYDGSFTDGGENYISTLKYLSWTHGTSSKLYPPPDMYSEWPGGPENGSGGVFRFSPPVLRHRQKRSVMTLKDSRSFVNGGEDREPFFSDQHTIAFTSTQQTIEYPSMLPVALKTNNSTTDASSVAGLFASGSITVSRSNLRPGMFDEVLDNVMIEDRVRRRG